MRAEAAASKAPAEPEIDDAERFPLTVNEPAATGRMPEDVLSNHPPHFASLIEPTLSTGVTAFVAAREWPG